MSLPTLGESLSSLFAEAADGGREVSGRLRAAGLDGLTAERALALTALIAPRPAVAGMLAVLGIPPEAAVELTESLIRDGYLERRAAPGGQSRVGATGQGVAVADAVLTGLMAARWAGLPLRPDDIVISSWPKSGTTWLQMICALLVFQVPELPAPLGELSPWPEELSLARDEIGARLAAQRHRRFIKSHLPLGAIPADPKVSYLVIARHPLDAAISAYFEQRNIAPPHHGAASGHHTPRPPGPAPSREPPAPPGPAPQRPAPVGDAPHDWLLRWLDGPELPRMLSHLTDAWDRRAEPNVVLLHYHDLCADLDGQMRRLAANLDIVVPESTWPGLVRAAGFEQMRAAADHLAPDRTFKSKAGFFRRGTPGSGRELLSPAELARYDRRAAQLAPPGLLAWLHHDDRPG
jgi:aryl sulfotransferase